MDTIAMGSKDIYLMWHTGFPDALTISPMAHDFHSMRSPQIAINLFDDVFVCLPVHSEYFFHRAV